MSRKVFALVAAVALLIPSTAIAAPPEDAAHDYVMVLLKDPPIASYEGGINNLERTKPVRGKLDPSSPAYQAYARHLADERANYRAFLARNAPDADVLGEYDTVLNGFAVKLNGTSTGTLANGPGARMVEASWLYQPTMNISVDVINADAAWGTGGPANAGSDIKVGVIDSGIDDSHLFFGCKQAIEHDVYTSGDAGDTSQLLVFDHGTHVAGTIGGCVIDLPAGGPITGKISGVAPGVTLHDYNVFPGYGSGFVAFGGSAFSHDIARALEDAVDDGMDVVNLSLGGGIQGPHDLLAEAVNATAEAGVVPAVSAGNSGPGAGTIGSPGNALGALTAGASTNPHFIGIPFTATTAAGSVSGGAALGDFKAFGKVNNVAYVKAQPAEGCQAITNASDVRRKIAIIDRGTCTFTTKVRNAQDAGAVGVLVVNNSAGDPTAMGHDGTSPFPTIPAAMVSKNDGAALGASGTVSIDGKNPTEIRSGNVDILAGFSSRGPTAFTADIKPDFTAPGVNVYSSVFNDGFAMFQGTSMAAPHVAGAAALLLDKYPANALTPGDVKSLLGNSASRTVTDHVNGKVDPGVMARGGGRIDLSTAITADVTFSPMSVSLGSHSGMGVVSESVTVTVTNLSENAKTLTLSESDDYMELSTASLNLVAGGSATFTVSLNVHRVADTNEGDISIADGGRTYLMPFWYSVGN